MLLLLRMRDAGRKTSVGKRILQAASWRLVYELAKLTKSRRIHEEHDYEGGPRY